MKRLGKALLFLVPVLFLLPHLGQVPFQPGGEFTDLLISHYPNGVFIQQSIEKWHTIPLWSNTILSGYPFAANPLAGLYYLPGWLALAFPLPLGFNIAIVLHLIWGGVGLYRFLRSEGLAELPALSGGLLFEALPKLYSHLAAGHITLIYAVVWTPWLLEITRRMGPPQLGHDEQPHSKFHRLRWVLPGLVLGMIALADIRWAAYAGLLWVGYWITLVIKTERLAGETKQWTKRLTSHLPPVVTNGVVAFMAAAPLLLPLMEYTRLSTRSWLSAADNLMLSLPPGQLLGVFYPNIGGMAEWVLYPGAVATALTIYTLACRAARRAAWFWLAVIGLSLLTALGSNLPIMTAAAHLPGLDLLRVPPRVLFLAGMGFAVTAGYALDQLAIQPHPHHKAADLTLFAVTVFVVLLAGAVMVMVDNPHTRLQFAWGAVAFMVAAGLLFLGANRRISPAVLVGALLTAGLADLTGVNYQSVEFRPFEAVLSQGRAAAELLLAQADGVPFRTYSPSYSLPQQTAAWLGVELADGVDPLQSAAYVRYMTAATGVPNPGYSVTLPPFPNGEPAVDNRLFQPDAARLGRLNVRYVLAEYQLTSPGLVWIARFGQTQVYRNTLALPRAWVQPADELPGQGAVPVESIDLRPNQIWITARGPGLFVLAEQVYPGWQALVDNQPAQITPVDGLLRGINLPAGEHEIVFSFQPWPVFAGLGVAIAACVSAIILYFRSRTAHD